ncbi:DedA family protein [Candidatus Woesearchaeota archaeon]|nr:DedA family protein [Candidatus Woesearchaeota archaeon]
MSILTEILSHVGVFCIQVISYLGYFGVFVLMTMESMIFPIPSELVMPFAGFLAATGEMNLYLVIVFSSLGSIFGSWLSYCLGRYGGNRFILKYGKYFFLDETDLMKTEKWFKEKGEKTVLISRFIPVVRHLISIPAGIGKMDLKKFFLYTLIGATAWNAFLAYLGFLLGKNWALVRAYSEYFSIIIVALLLIAGSYFIYRHIKHKLKKTN